MLVRSLTGAAAVGLVLSLLAGVRAVEADTPVLSLRAAVVGADAAGEVTVVLVRWSADAERAPLLTAFAAPPPAPTPPPEAAGAAAGRGGRGGLRGRGAAPPADPLTRLAAAVQAAPTVGFIWADGPTGYSIKYAWRSSQGGRDRIVLVTDRRLGAHLLSWPPASGPAAEADFTVIELRVDAEGVGEGKASLMAGVVIDAAASTLALDDYEAAPVLFEVMP